MYPEDHPVGLPGSKETCQAEKKGPTSGKLGTWIFSSGELELLFTRLMISEER